MRGRLVESEKHLAEDGVFIAISGKLYNYVLVAILCILVFDLILDFPHANIA